MEAPSPALVEELRARILALETQQQSSAKFEVMVEMAPLAILTVDSKRCVRHVNRNAAQLFGFESSELIGQNLEILIPEPMRGGHEKVSSDYQRHPEAREMGKGRYLNGRQKDGSLIPVEIALSPIILDGEQCVMALIADITLRRKWELEREALMHRITEAQKLESIGVLAGGVAHDFNNILTGILLNASLLDSIAPEDEDHKLLVGAILESSARAADLCKQLLAYAGKGRLVMETRDLSALVQSSTRLVQAMISKDSVLHYELQTPGPLVTMDTTQMSQVVMNLVINASEAASGAAVTITIRSGLLSVDKEWLSAAVEGSALVPGTYAMVSVADNGSGISVEDQKRIFEPFFTTKFQGRGLGLSAVLGIIRAHQGALHLDSQTAQGSRFTVLLPLASGAAINAHSGLKEEGPQKLQVLVVDDDEAILKSSVWALRRAGFECDSARNGVEALMIFRADHSRYHLIIIDLTMPRMDGLETCRRLRSVNPNIPIILMSGYGEVSLRLEDSRTEFTAFLPKPFTSESLLAVVNHAIKRLP